MPKIQHRRGTATNLAAANPTPLAGELVWDSTENAIKIGTGSTAWTSLAYVTATPRTGSVTTATIADDAVTYAKLQNVSATDRLLGRSSSGAGNVEEITCTAFGRSLIDDADAAAGRTTLAAAPLASPTFTGTVTVPGLTSTGVILADDAATANSVVYSFDGDPNTGIGRGGADVLTVVTNGSERLRVRSDGNVGVGYSGAATHRFGVSGDISGTGSNIIILGAGTAAAAATQVYSFYSSPGVGASASLSVLAHYSAVQGTVSGAVTAQTGYACGDLTAATNNYGFRSAVSSATGRWNFYAEGTAQNYFAGNVGIGASRTTPSSALDVNGVITVAAGTAAAPAIVASGDSNTGLAFSTDTLIFATAGVERVRIDAGGRVGIGHATPADFNQVVNTPHLVVGNGTNTPGVTLYSGTGNAGSIAFADGTAATDQYRGLISYNHALEAMRFFVASSERVRIDSSGRVAIGTTYTSNGQLTLAEGQNTRLCIDTGSNVADSALGVDFIDRHSATGQGAEGQVGGFLRCIRNGSNAEFSVAIGTTSSTTDDATEKMRVKATGAIRFVPLSADPASGEAGDVYYNSSTNKLRVYNGTSWVDLH